MTQRIGHRGAAGHAPENTLASVRKALEIGVDGIEFDVHRSKDGVIVVMHDPTVDRTSDGTGRIADMSLAELRTLDLGSWKGPRFAGERIATLEEFVAEIPSPLKLFLELKAGNDLYPGIEEQVAQFLTERGLVQRTNISSFDHFVLLRMRQLLPQVETGMLYSARPIDPIAMARACGASALHAKWGFISPEVVAEAHAHGLTVNAWTPNSPEAVAACQRLGVDGIITDYPELVQRLTPAT